MCSFFESKIKCNNFYFSFLIVCIFSCLIALLCLQLSYRTSNFGWVTSNVGEMLTKLKGWFGVWCFVGHICCWICNYLCKSGNPKLYVSNNHTWQVFYVGHVGTTNNHDNWIPKLAIAFRANGCNSRLELAIVLKSLSIIANSTIEFATWLSCYRALT